MKKIKLLVWVFVAWQIATMFCKDEKFKKKYNESVSFDKVKVVFSSLIDLNKNIFFKIKDIDYEAKFKLFKKTFDKERIYLESKIEELRMQLDNKNEEILKPKIKDLEDKVLEFRDKAYENAIDIDKKYWLREKSEELIEKVRNLKNSNKLSKNYDNSEEND